MTTRYTQRIDVGVYEDKVGYTAFLEDGTPEHHLFSAEVAEQLALKLLSLVAEQRQYIRRQMPHDRVGVRDGVQVRITPPREEQEP